MPAIKSTNALYAYLNAGWVDLTTDVQEKASLNANWGMDGNGPLDIVGDIGELRFTLRNDDGKYYPDGGSPLSGWGWGVPIKVTMAYGGNTRTLRYYVEDIKLNVGKVAAQSTVTVTALDWFKFAQEHPIAAPSVEINKTADEGITTLLGLVSPIPQATDFDTGAYTFKAIFDSVGMRGNAYTELVKLAVSEYGHLYLKKDATYGETLAFENATARNSGAITATINAAIDDVELHYGENIINRATATAYPKRFDTETQVLYKLARAIPIRAGETLPDFRVRYIDPTGGGRPVHALVDTMQTPEVPGAVDASLMTLLNFHGGFYDETTRHTWTGNDVSILNDVYTEAASGNTYISGAILGHYALFGGYPYYYMYTPSSADFDFGSGAFTIGWYESKINAAAGNTTMARDGRQYAPYILGYTDGTNMLIYMSSNGSTYDIASGRSLGPVNRGHWTYYEINRDEDGWFYAFADGQLTDKWHSPLAMADGVDQFLIGYTQGGYWCFMGFDSFFVKKGVCWHKTDFTPPSRNILPYVEGDYLLNTLEDGTGTNLSASLDITATYDATGVTYSLTNNSAQDGFIIHLQARGKGVYAEGTLETYVEDATSIISYNYREISLDQKYQQNLNAGTSIITSIIAAEKDPRTELRAVSFFANKSTTTMENCLLRDVGDLVRVVVSDTGIDNYYHIQNIGMSVKSGGIIYVTWGLKPAYAIDPDFGGGGGDGVDVINVGGGSSNVIQVGISQAQTIGVPTLTIQNHVSVVTDISQLQTVGTTVPTSDYVLTVEDIEQVQYFDIPPQTYPLPHAPSHAVSAADTIFPADPNADKYLMWDDVPGVLVWGTPPTLAHKDSHDPNDGSDPLDTAAPAEIASVQAAGTGTSHSLARADHQHQIQHSIANNHIVTIDSASAASGEITRLTTLGLESRSNAEVKTQLGYVSLTGNETVAGIKTFSSFPVTPSSAPTTNYQAANKKYVDDTTFIIYPFAYQLNAIPLTATDTVPFAASASRNLTFVQWNFAWNVYTTNDASNYWTIALQRRSDFAVIKSFTTAAGSIETWYLNTETSFTISTGSAADLHYRIFCTKTGSPGPLYLAAPILEVTIP